MRIAHVIWGLKAGGAELMLIDIVNEQVKVHEVAIVIVNDEIYPSVKDALDKNVRLFHIRRPPGSRNPWHLLKLNLSLHQYRPDIMHCHQDALISLIWSSKIPKVLTLHETKIVLSNRASKYNTIYCISRSVQSDMKQRYPKLETCVAYNGIRTGLQAMKISFNFSPFRIVQVSNLIHEKKGQDLLIRAVSVLVHKYKINLKLDFIGEGFSDKFLMSLVKELGLENYCNFLGMKTRQYIYENLSNYDLLVQPSRKEGFGLTVIEAMTSGVPVLVSDVEGPMEIIEFGKFGFYFRNGDYDDICAQILNIMKLSKEDDFHEFCTRAKQYVDRKFDISFTAQTYTDDYKRVIADFN